MAFQTIMVIVEAPELRVLGQVVVFRWILNSLAI